jgi:hypothetical protein
MSPHSPSSMNHQKQPVRWPSTECPSVTGSSSEKKPFPVRRRSPGRTDAPAHGDPVQPDQRRIHLPRQHHRPPQPHHPAPTKEGRTADAVDDRVNTIHRMNVRDALEQARTLWEGMLDASRSQTTSWRPTRKATAKERSPRPNRSCRPLREPCGKWNT